MQRFCAVNANLFFFPDCVWYTIFEKFLVVNDLVNLDSAVCNNSIREIFLKRISGGTTSFRGRVATLAQRKTDNDYVLWLHKRNIFIRSLILTSETFYPSNITDQSLVSYCDQCLRLQEINFYGLKVSDSTFVTLIAASPNLRKLYLSECSLLTNMGFVAISMLKRALHLLEVLSIGFCRRIDDEGMRAFGQRCASLQRLEIVGNQMADEGLASIAMHARESLKYVDISLCSSIQSAGWQKLGECCTKLEKFKLRDCSVTHQGIANVFKQSGGTLVKIELEDCGRLSNKTLLDIGLYCHNLEKLKLDGCGSRFHDGGVIGIAAG